MMRPGPLAPIARPRRKMTPRSYSRRILIALVRTRSARNSTIAAETEIIAFPSLGLVGFMDPQPDAVDLVDDHRRALLDVLFRLRRPVRAMHEHLPIVGAQIGDRDAALTVQPFPARQRLAPHRAVSGADDEREEQHRDSGDQEDHREREAEAALPAQQDQGPEN